MCDYAPSAFRGIFFFALFLNSSSSSTCCLYDSFGIFLLQSWQTILASSLSSLSESLGRRDFFAFDSLDNDRGLFLILPPSIASAISFSSVSSVVTCLGSFLRGATRCAPYCTMRPSSDVSLSDWTSSVLSENVFLGSCPLEAFPQASSSSLSSVAFNGM